MTSQGISTGYDFGFPLNPVNLSALVSLKPAKLFLLDGLKKMRNSYFCVTPQNTLVNVCLKKIIKSFVTKKVIVCFYKFGEGNF